MKLVSVIVCLCALLAISAHARNTVVLVDDLAIERSHSIFFQALRDAGHELDIQRIDGDVELDYLGEYNYDSAIIFAPHAEDVSRAVRSEKILEFVDSGRDVLIAADNDYSYYSGELAFGSGARFDPHSTGVVDHFNFDVSCAPSPPPCDTIQGCADVGSDFDGDHSLIVAENYDNVAVFGDDTPSPILYRGVGMRLVEGNSLVFPLLRGYATSYSCVPDEPIDEMHTTGGNLVLVAGLQARNNARIAITGSIELFSDEFVNANVERVGQEPTRSGNLDFASRVAAWTFHRTGVLRMAHASHHRVGEEGQQHGTYSVMEELQYNVRIEELVGDEWKGFAATDVQLELQMLDPYIRQTLEDLGDGNYVAKFVAPDVYGVYTFKLDYSRIGYTFLSERDIVTIRPLRHDEYERFLTCAYPYYVGAFSMMAGVVLFSFIFMFSS